MKAPQSNIKLFLYTPNKFFVIPNFQRPYSWTAENIDSFLSDLEDIKNSGKNHYFGSIVYVNDGDGSIIIDGQQRATTVLLMITAIYHLALKFSNKCSIVAEQIKDQYLYNKYAEQYGTEENRIKLRAVTSDNEVFEKIFSQQPLSSAEEASRLNQAYRRFYDYFSTRDNLEKYINTLESFEIVTIILDKDDDNPQRVFESINSTGKPLTDGDKIRNFALMLNSSNKQNHVLKNYWQKIEQTLTDADKDYITDFFRMYIIATKQNTVKLNAVYPEFKKLFAANVSDDQSIESLDAFYGDIVKILEYYKFLRFSGDAPERFRDIAEVAFIMRYLAIDLYTPFAISVMRAFDSGDITKEQMTAVFSYIKVYFSRRIVCNILSTSVDRLFATLHRDAIALVESGEADYVDAVAYVLLSKTGQLRLPSDTEVAASVKANSAYGQRPSNVNYILTALDDTSKDSALLRQIQSKELKLSIEHIMPQTLTDAWRKELGDDAERIHDTYLHGLANLTLTGYNSEYSNLPFERKKTMPHGFDDSPLVINKSVAKHDHWTETALIERQQWWIDRLCAVWPLPVSSYIPDNSGCEVDLLNEVDLTGTAPLAITIKNTILPASNWALAVDAVTEHCYESDSNFYDIVMRDEWLRGFFTTDANKFNASQEIFDTGIYIHTQTSTIRKQQLIRKLAGTFGLERGDLIVELKDAR